MQPEDLITLTAARGVDATKAFEVPGTGPVRWTIAEAALACRGMERTHFHALLYSYAGDDSCFWSLHAALDRFTAALARREGWRPHINPWTMAAIVLCEERSPDKFKDSIHGEDIRRVLMVVPRHVWRQEGKRGYEAVRHEYAIWLAEGIGAMVRRLSGRDRATA